MDDYGRIQDERKNDNFPYHRIICMVELAMTDLILVGMFKNPGGDFSNMEQYSLRPNMSTMG